MRIDRGLRTAITVAYPTGYRAPTPASLNTERGRVAIASQERIAPEDFQALPFPQTIALMARLNAQRISDPCEVISERWSPLRLYGGRIEKFAHRSVALLYHGLGKLQWNNGGPEFSFRGYDINALNLTFLNNEGIIFEKTFLHQAVKLFIAKEALRGYCPLWAYGGFFETGCGIAAIEQSVFTVATTCEIAASPLSFWKNKDRALSGEPLRFFSDFKPKHWRTLAGDIETGQVRVDLCYGLDEHGETCRQIYRSFRFIQHNLDHGIIEIFFSKEEN